MMVNLLVGVFDRSATLLIDTSTFVSGKASGAAGSLAVGAIVLGYYVTYFAGLGRRLRRHEKHLTS